MRPLLSLCAALAVFSPALNHVNVSVQVSLLSDGSSEQPDGTNHRPNWLSEISVICFGIHIHELLLIFGLLESCRVLSSAQTKLF